MSQDDDLDGGPDSDEHPPTDRVQLPDVVPSSAAPFQVHIPGPPGVPTLGPEEPTRPPGAMTPPDPDEEPIITAVRNAAREGVRLELGPLREEVDRLSNQMRLYDDPEIGWPGLIRSLEDTLQEAIKTIAEFREIAKKVFVEVERVKADDREQKNLVDERLGDHARQLRGHDRRADALEKRVDALERWREDTRDDGR